MKNVSKNVKWLVGIDEVGRGPLAGPVTVSAVCIAFNEKNDIFKEFKDSKQLTHKKREGVFLKIKELSKKRVLSFSISHINSKVIDKNGIKPAIDKAILKCLKDLDINPVEAKVFLDGTLFAPKEFIYQETIIGGDRKNFLISAASILGKVARDRKMVAYEKKYPQYGFAKHKGYGTKHHIEIINKYGLSPIHRRGFCANMLDEK